MSDDVPMEGVEDMAVDSDSEMGEFTAPTAGVPAPPPPAPQPPSQLQPGGDPTPPPPPEPLETDAATAKRRAIQAIMRDLSLPDVERRRRVQTLMDGTADAAQNAPGGPASTEGLLAGAVAAAAAKLEGGGGNGGGNRNMRTGGGGGGAGLAGQVNVE